MVLLVCIRQLSFTVTRYLEYLTVQEKAHWNGSSSLWLFGLTAFGLLARQTALLQHGRNSRRNKVSGMATQGVKGERGQRIPQFPSGHDLNNLRASHKVPSLKYPECHLEKQTLHTWTPLGQTPKRYWGPWAGPAAVVTAAVWAAPSSNLLSQDSTSVKILPDWKTMLKIGLNYLKAF